MVDQRFGFGLEKQLSITPHVIFPFNELHNLSSVSRKFPSLCKINQCLPGRKETN